jgi:hypothetical protein
MGHWDRPFSEYFGFSMLIFYTEAPQSYISFGGLTKCPLVAAVQREPQPINMNNKNNKEFIVYIKPQSSKASELCLGLTSCHFIKTYFYKIISITWTLKLPLSITFSFQNVVVI